MLGVQVPLVKGCFRCVKMKRYDCDKKISRCLLHPRNFLQRGKACAVPFRSIFRSSGSEQEDWRDPAR